MCGYKVKHLSENEKKGERSYEYDGDFNPAFGYCGSFELHKY